MIVVSDTSPILNLSAIGRLDLLRSLYQELVIPPAVAIELERNGVDHPTLEWLLLREPTNGELVKQLELRLDPGESEAIAIALELGADRILLTSGGPGESPRTISKMSLIKSLSGMHTFETPGPSRESSGVNSM